MQPKVGDTVILRAVVHSINTHYSSEIIKVSFIDCPQPGHFPSAINVSSVHAIAPREPRVGDTVWYEGAPFDGGTLLHIHQGEGDNRKWATVAFKGDIPKSFYFDQVRTNR